MSRTIKNIFILFIVFLLILAWWSSLNIGLSGDEYSHHINGLKRFNFLITLGEAKNYHFYNNELYPGIYDTLSYTFGLRLEIKTPRLLRLRQLHRSYHKKHPSYQTNTSGERSTRVSHIY